MYLPRPAVGVARLAEAQSAAAETEGAGCEKRRGGVNEGGGGQVVGAWAARAGWVAFSQPLGGNVAVRCG